MLSPKPGVSTMVSAMRTPSSLSSVKGSRQPWSSTPRIKFEMNGVEVLEGFKEGKWVRTDVDGLNLDALLDVGHVGVVGHLMGEDLALAERVHERRTARPGRACAHAVAVSQYRQRRRRT